MSLLTTYVSSLRPLGRFKTLTSGIVIANILLAGTAVLEPIQFGRVVDAISKGRMGLVPLGLWVAFAMGGIVVQVLTARAADRLAHRCRAEMLAASFEDLVAMPIPWHNQRGASNVFQTLVRACETLFNIWLEFLRTHLATALSLIVLVPTALATNPTLGAVLVALGLTYWWIAKAVMAKTEQGQRSLENHYHNVFHHLSDTINNVAVLHSFNRIQIEAKILRDRVEALLQAQFPILDWWAFAAGMNRLAATISMIAILLIGSHLVGTGTLSIGDVVAFIGFAGIMIGRLDQMRGFVSQTFEAIPKLEEFVRLRDEARSVKQTDHQGHLAPVRGRVEFRDVSLRFASGGWGVRNISFAVEPGQTVAIVGPTGAGKSTIINLLQRIYEPTSGMILIDDVDIAMVSKESVRDQVATVMQDVGLLNRSIADNIRLGRNHALLADVRDAAVAAAADEFVRRRPNGYDCVVGDRGSELSGGERQRIAIARAILKSAPILVLDEATSALDVETEALIKTALYEFSRDRTTFVIAHRLSTVRHADLVLVINDGRIVESGSYQSLQGADGHFSRLLEASGIAA